MLEDPRETLKSPRPAASVRAQQSLIATDQLELEKDVIRLHELENAPAGDPRRAPVVAAANATAAAAAVAMAAPGVPALEAGVPERSLSYCR